MTEIFGIENICSACMKFMILPGARFLSASVPMAKPGVSTSMTSGMLKLSHSTRKLVIFSHASVSSAPPFTSGLLATMPTVRPPMRDSAVTATLPKRCW